MPSLASAGSSLPYPQKTSLELQAKEVEEL
jgi:hypothetical protein